MKISSSIFLILFTSTCISVYGTILDSLNATNPITMLEGYNPQAEGLVISAIDIKAPKRSKVSFIKSLLHIKVGDIYTKTRHKLLYKYLWTSNLFYNIAIIPLIEDNQVVLTISLKDKWTLLAIPSVHITPNDIKGGLLLTDVNFLGLGKVLLLSGAYGTNSYDTNIVYIDRSILGSPILLTTIASLEGFNRVDYSHGNARVLYNPKNNTINNAIRKYQGLLFNGTIGIGYQFPYNLTLYGAVSYIEYWNHITDGLDSDFSTYNPLPSSRHIPFLVSLDYDGLTPYGIMSQGLEAKMEYSFALYSTQKNFFQGLRTTGSYQLGIGEKQIQLLKIFLESLVSDYPLILSERIGGTNTTHTLSKSSVATNNYLGISVEYLFLVWKNQLFGITTSFGVDCSIYEITKEHENFSQPALNSGVFLSTGVLFNQIAVPLLQVIVGYNFLNQYPTFGISIGL